MSRWVSRKGRGTGMVQPWVCSGWDHPLLCPPKQSLTPDTHSVPRAGHHKPAVQEDSHPLHPLTKVVPFWVLEVLAPGALSPHLDLYQGSRSWHCCCRDTQARSKPCSMELSLCTLRARQTYCIGAVNANFGALIS